MSKRDQLKDRFGAHQVWNVLRAARDMVGPEDSPISNPETASVPSSSVSSGAARRSEYKGKRKQVAFRLRESACRKVKLVLELRRGAGNDFFEAALEAAADAELCAAERRSRAGCLEDGRNVCRRENQKLRGPTMRGLLSTIDPAFQGRPGSVFVDYYVQPKEPKEELNWSTLRLVFERMNDRWFLVEVVKKAWTP